MDAIEALLFTATCDALDTFGESTRLAFLWHLDHEKIPFSQKGMDIALIEAKLRQFFGSAAPVMIQIIYQRFMMSAATEGYFSTETLALLNKLPKNANTETIMRLVTQHHKSNRTDG